jgi:hypothetical protein
MGEWGVGKNEIAWMHGCTHIDHAIMQSCNHGPIPQFSKPNIPIFHHSIIPSFHHSRCEQSELSSPHIFLSVLRISLTKLLDFL